MSLNVLIVDDSPVTRKIVAKVLKMTEVPVGETAEAGNGAEALEKLDEKKFDICFVDINMPVMNGIELIQNMSKRGLLETTSVIIISTEGSATRLAELTQMGVTEHIRKPFVPETFEEVVNRVVSQRHAH